MSNQSISDARSVTARAVETATTRGVINEHLNPKLAQRLLDGTVSKVDLAEAKVAAAHMQRFVERAGVTSFGELMGYSALRSGAEGLVDAIEGQIAAQGPVRTFFESLKDRVGGFFT